MLKLVKDVWARNLTENNETATHLFTSGLYVFLILKILFLLPIASDMVMFYHYHSASLIKQIIVGPGIISRQFPVSFLISSGLIISVLLFVKRTYYLNGLGFWLSLNITQLSEPVANGADYVLNLMLLLSIPLSSKPPILRWKELQSVFFNFSVILIQAHIALIYFLSGFDKLMTKSWRTGEAISYVASLDYYANPILSALQSPYLNLTVAWCVISIELAFPLLVWFKTFRAPLLIAGVLFHTGIIYFLNLPDFGLLIIICYAIFIRFKKELIQV